MCCRKPVIRHHGVSKRATLFHRYRRCPLLRPGCRDGQFRPRRRADGAQQARPLPPPPAAPRAAPPRPPPPPPPPPPLPPRRVARLEERLGARLLPRTARGAQPTDIGQAYYARAANILAELDAA